MSTLSDIELKKKILRLLEVDEEFRLAVAAKIGLLEILSELKKLREDFNKLFQKSLEHDKRFEVIERKLLEHDKRFEEINKRFEAIERKLLEHDKRFEEINKRFEAIERKLLEHDKRFEAIESVLALHSELLRKLLERVERHERALGALGENLGLLMEFVLSKEVLEVIRERVRGEGDEVVRALRRHRVDREYEVDLFVETRRRVYVVEVKSRPSVSHVEKLARVRSFLAQKERREVVAILASFKEKVLPEVEARAREEGVEVLAL